MTLKTYSDIVKQVYGYFWLNVFKDQTTVDALADMWGLIYEQQNIYNIEKDTYLNRIDCLLTNEYRWEYITFSKNDLVINEESYVESGGVVYGCLSSPPQYKLPLDSLLTVPFLSSSPSKNTTWLFNNHDFIVSDGYIYFKNNPFTSNLFKTQTAIDSDGIVDTTLKCWAYCCKKDTGIFKQFYGTYTNIKTVGTDFFKTLTNVIWDLYVEGATSYNIKNLLACLTDCDIAEHDGVVESIWEENNRLWVSVTTGLYNTSTDFSSIVSVGDSIKKGDLLFNNYSLYAPEDTIPSTSLPAFTAAVELLAPEYEGGLLFENTDVALTFEYMAGKEGIEILTNENGLILYQDGNDVKEILVDDSEAVDINTGIVKVPIFTVHGLANDIEKFKRNMAHQAWIYKIDLFSILTEGQNSGSYTVNPFTLIRNNSFKNNAYFTILNKSFYSEEAAGKSFSFLKETLPAGTTMFIYRELSVNEETYECSDIEELIVPSIVYITEDTYTDYADNKPRISGKTSG